MDRKELSMELHKQGFNCAQCVVCSYCNVLGYDPVTAFKMAEAFGFGMGSAGTCGAVSGMAMVIGMKTSDGDLDNPKTKRESYNLMRRATGEFLRKNKSIVCREIKGMDGGPVLCSCDDCIKDSIGILDELLLGIKD
ncbi:C-GCAxxG-C-C family protein [Aminicella lysinilytica]|uniref:C_GCAxxG_C_C family probable redox protein n=1 Tax=Aminicella lysinilytica TaxID=433323 RepID=A0A4R6Q092_9FIRM|nr:C-GCAxxG-C-C family protein [Aminicella lysinilytica]NLD10438.1 C_GCAxxG_C_C family protein [Clostridiales bacterium]TDP54377.1 C_GCAxxG_C_C family probable redox protein [Aminicella lysinilytica]